MSEIKQQKLGSDAAVLTSSKVAVMVMSMVSTMLLSRFRSLEEYGTYSQLIMVVNLVCSIVMLGLPNSVNYFLAKAESEEDKSRFLSIYYTISTILSIASGLILFLCVPLFEIYFDNPMIKSFWYFLLAYPWTKIVMSSIENFLVVIHKVEKLMLFRFLNSLVLVLDVLIVGYINGSFQLYMLLFLATEVIFTIWSYIIVNSNTLYFKFLIDKNFIKEIFKFSIPIGVASMIGTVNIELDKLVISNFFSTEELAIYTNASKELPVTVIASSMTAVILPKMVNLLSKNKNEEAVKIWKSATTISFAVICLFSIGIFVFAPEVITLLYSEKYLPGVAVFRIYSLILMLKCTYYGMILNAAGKTKFILYSSIGTLIINFILNLLFYRMFGFIGPAVATLFSTLIMQTYQLFYSARYLKIKFLQIFPFKNTILILLVNICLGIVFYYVKALLEVPINDVVFAIILGVVWSGVFALIIYKLVRKNWSILNNAD